jgi:hypothetical protein
MAASRVQNVDRVDDVLDWGSKVRTLRWLAIIPLVAAALTTGTAARGAPAAPPKHPTEFTFITPTRLVTTSTHHKLSLQMEVIAAAGATLQNLGFGVSLAVPHGDEGHLWFFPLKDGSFVVNRSTFSGSLKTGASQISPYGVVSLQFTRVGKPSITQCSTSKTVTHRLHVEGIVEFNTHSAGPHHWGGFGSLRKKVTFSGRGSLKVQYGAMPCTQTPSKVTCRTSVSWQVDNEAGTTLGGAWTLSHGKVKAHLSASRQVLLTKPTGALRIDDVQIPAPPPALTTKLGKPTLIVTTEGSSADGSATVVSNGLASPTTHPCSKTHHEIVEGFSGASYTNGDSALTLHEQIEGPISLPDQPMGAVINLSRQTD